MDPSLHLLLVSFILLLVFISVTDATADPVLGSPASSITANTNNRLSPARSSTGLSLHGFSAIKQINNQSSIEGDSVLIPCWVTGPLQPSIFISWSKDGRNLPFNHRQRILKNGSLEIVNLNKDIDSGMYTCSLEEKESSSTGDSSSPSVVPFGSSPTASSHLSSRRIAQQSMFLEVKGKFPSGICYGASTHCYFKSLDFMQNMICKIKYEPMK